MTNINWQSNTRINANTVWTSDCSTSFQPDFPLWYMQVKADKGNTPSPEAVFLKQSLSTHLQLIYATAVPQTVVAKVRERWFAIHDTQDSICEGTGRFQKLWYQTLNLNLDLILIIWLPSYKNPHLKIISFC